nr:MAG TPA: hypothetical protein [Caudoviricetes sp.]
MPLWWTGSSYGSNNGSCHSSNKQRQESKTETGTKYD